MPARFFWLLLLVLGGRTIDDFVVSILYLVDALMIFGNERRYLHDYIAGSKVVLYRENRPLLP